MINVKEIADNADLIVNGYAFTKCDFGYRVLNLNRPTKAAVFSREGEMLETSMDDIELRIVKNYLEQDRMLMEE